MKIIFLQKVDNARGGVINVNIGLMNYLLKKGYIVELISIRHGPTWEKIHYPLGVKQVIINSSNVWGCPLLSNVLSLLKKGKFVKALQMILERIKYKRGILNDYKKCQKELIARRPDIIINSHYEVLAGIPKEYLKKTIMHFHTNFEQVKENRSYVKTFQKYKDQIAYFVWLSQSTCNSAIENGFVNSLYIYNALPFNEDSVADTNNKKIVFVGRIAEEKRVWLAIEHFIKVTKHKELQDWFFEIYGDGEEVEKIKKQIEPYSNIVYKGRSENVQKVFLSSSLMILTSKFEGMPLVVLEANECGVPVIAYDFGEASKEVIVNKKTGIIVPQDHFDSFNKELENLMLDKSSREYLAKNAKEFARTFTMDEIGSNWINLFSQIHEKTK